MKLSLCLYFSPPVCLSFLLLFDCFFFLDISVFLNNVILYDFLFYIEAVNAVVSVLKKKSFLNSRFFWGGGRRRSTGRGRVNPKQAHAQHGTDNGARSHDPEIMT